MNKKTTHAEFSNITPFLGSWMRDEAKGVTGILVAALNTNCNVSIGSILQKKDGELVECAPYFNLKEADSL